MILRRLLLLTLCAVFVSACQTLPPSPTQTLHGLKFDPWPWAPVTCFGCEWEDKSIDTTDGRIARVEARKSGELVIVASRNDAGGDVMPGFSIKGVAEEGKYGISFANSYKDASVKIKDNHGVNRTLTPGQHSLVKINNVEWMLYIVKASQWQDGMQRRKYLLDWVLLKTEK